MRYLKETITVMLIGCGLILTAFVIAAGYTVRIILDEKKKW
jgi:hypothetical protein